MRCQLEVKNLILSILQQYRARKIPGRGTRSVAESSSGRLNQWDDEEIARLHLVSADSARSVIVQ